MSDVWVFGYGSLIWRPSFPYLERRKAWVRGFSRRLWQGSDDHRGVPGALGRVATLVEDPDARVVGAAFRVAGALAEDVLRALDHREKNGYSRHEVPLLDDAGAPFASAILFVAGRENPNFLGPEPIEAMARRIATAVGPSGTNLEYVLELGRAIRELGEHDPHLEEIAAALASLPVGASAEQPLPAVV